MTRTRLAQRTSSCSVFLVALFVALPAKALAAHDGAVPYRELDNIEGAWVELNLFPIRPMVITRRAPTELFAVNTSANTIEGFVGAGPAAHVYRVPWGPVSIGSWVNPNSDREELLVVCRGSHVLVRMARKTGRTIQVIQLPHEPADLVIDAERNRAFVSCTGAAAVVQIDLLTGEQVQYDARSHSAFRCVAPLFMSFDEWGRVLVAPQVSGNNTTAEKDFLRRAGERVLDLGDTSIAVTGLPDEDLFRIDPDLHSVTPVARGLAAVQFSQGTNPVTGELWQLGTEALNGDPVRQTEIALRGNFIQNRIAIVTPTAASEAGLLPGPHVIVDLDDTSSELGVQFDRDQSVGQPCGLAFASDGRAFVTGLLTDNLVVLDASGRRLAEVDLPDGSIPRAVLHHESLGIVAVYCWGQSEIRILNADTLEHVVSLELTRDSTPERIARGRRLFYDGSRSRFNNASCASCHVDGRTDFLVWNLSSAMDNKGPMVTQTLVGIQRLRPLHWRGERAELLNFNGAFPALLGGEPLDETRGGDFDDFEAFVMSLRAPANPNQNRERVLDDSIIPPGIKGRVSAVEGQRIFFDVLSQSSSLSCNDCHTLPVGTNHEVVTDDVDLLPRRAHFKVAAFNELWRKPRETVDLELWVDPNDHSLGTHREERVFLGAGLTHAGLQSFEEFLDVFQISKGEQRDVNAFLFQMDQGLAPAVHHAFLLDSRTVLNVQNELANYLIQQMTLRYCDVVAFGWLRVNTDPRPISWSFDRNRAKFVPDDPSVPERTLVDFVTSIASESHVFVGLPLGTGMSFAIDRDQDGLVDSIDANPDVPDDLVDGERDLDPPGFTLDPRSPWGTTTSARVTWETDEPTRFRITWFSNAGDVHMMESTDYATARGVLVREMLPSTRDPRANYDARSFDYEVYVEAFDRGGNRAAFLLPKPIRSGSLTRPQSVDDDVLINALGWTRFEDLDVDAVQITAAAFVSFLRGGPPAVPARDRLVIARVFVNGQLHEDVSPLRPKGIVVERVQLADLGHTIPLGLEGPFVIGRPTDGGGRTEFAFEVNGLDRGDVLGLNIEAVIAVDAARMTELRRSFVSVSACELGTGPLNTDCNGDGSLDCCALRIPVGHAARSFAHWNPSATPEQYRDISEIVDPARATRLMPPRRR